jgi:protein-S-isoprenylcysteine O-methyltransferase Ste14
MSPVSQRASEAVMSGVMTRPPVLYAVSLILGLGLDRLLPLPFALPGSVPMQWMVGGGLILIGVATASAGIRDFTRAATPVPSNQPVRALVTTGIHGWSRNPIYIGMLLLYAGIGVTAGSPWALVLALPLVVVLRYGVVAREEAYLERRFGDAYRDYKARVRRWL